MNDTSPRHLVHPDVTSTLYDEAARCRSLRAAWSLVAADRAWHLLDARDFTGLDVAEHDELASRLRATRLGWAARTATRDVQLAYALTALADVGVEPVVLKGTALGWTLYPQAVMRPGQDVDLLVDERQLPAVDVVLRRLGYELPYGVRGRQTSHQRLYVRELSGGARVQLDVHGRISNRHRFAGSLPWQTLRGRATPVALPVPGAGVAFAIAHEDAFVHAVVHLYAHHGVGERPALWFEDLRRLAQVLVDAGRWASVAQRVEELELCSLARDAVVLASARLGWWPPDLVMRAVRSWPDDSSGAFLRPGRLRDIASDLTHLPGWYERAQYVAELVAPSPEQMRAGWSEQGDESVLRLHARRLHRLARRR